MKTYVLNLKRRPERLAHMRSILPAELQAEYTTDWPIQVDARYMTTESIRDLGLFPWRMESDNKMWNRDLRMGQIGCAIAHWTCWQRSLETEDDLFLYLEDDVNLVPDFVNRLKDGIARLSAFDSRWDFLYLGRYMLNYPDEAVLEGIVRPMYSYSTCGYMLTRPALRKVLSTGYLQAMIPLDEFLPALYSAHPRADVRQVYSPMLRAYAFHPPLVTHISRHQGGSDTENSEPIVPGLIVEA